MEKRELNVYRSRYNGEKNRNVLPTANYYISTYCLIVKTDFIRPLPWSNKYWLMQYLVQSSLSFFLLFLVLLFFFFFFWRKGVEGMKLNKNLRNRWLLTFKYFQIEFLYSCKSPMYAWNLISLWLSPLYYKIGKLASNFLEKISH